jgi:hypothetical protein
MSLPSFIACSFDQHDFLSLTRVRLAYLRMLRLDGA